MGPLQLDAAVDVDGTREALARDGLVQVRNYLAPALALEIFDCLDRGTRWDLAWSENGRGRLIRAADLEKMTSQQVRASVDAAFDFSRSRFQFAYNTFKVIDSFVSREYPDHLLYRVADAMHAPAHLELMRRLTGCERVVRMDLMAARYLPGHFLTLHDDVVPGEGREIAYVLNLTREWLPEWGGLLHVVAANQRDVVRSFTPEFNSMVLFRPPRWHFVSQVASFARAPRYTLTGWMLSA